MTAYFGRDVSCTGSLRTGRLSSGVLLVAEAAARRLMTPRGTLQGGEEEANYGIDLSEFVGKVGHRLAVAALPDRIRAELAKDERIDAISTTTVIQTVGPATTIKIVVSCTTHEGPFELQLAVSAVSTELVSITTQEAA